MPYVKINHANARKMICAACGAKDKNCIDIVNYPTLIKLVKEIVNEGLEVNNQNEPTGLCKSCKTNMYCKKGGNVIPEVRETKWLLNKLIIETLPRFKGNDSNLNYFLTQRS